MTLTEAVDKMDKETLRLLVHAILKESQIFKHQLIEMLRSELNNPS